MNFPRLAALLLTSLCVAFSSLTSAQDAKARLLKATQGYTAVAFVKQAKAEFGLFTSISNTVFKPAGAGPFPAVVLVHTCGGVHDSHISEHGKELLAQGYAVLVLDSFGPRGISNCTQRQLSIAVGVMDTYAALDFLSRQAYVDKDRIFAVGYSWGGMVATLLASPESAAAFNTPNRFRATVSNYSTCIVNNGKIRLVLPDSDRPLLMLMGERDDEQPSVSCFPLLEEMKSAGAPVSWHVFPGVTHGWDKSGQAKEGYIYDETVAKEASQRMFEFLKAAK